MERSEEPMTKIMQLTQGQVALVDDWRFEELSRWKWSAQWNEKTKSFYAVRTEGSRLSQKKVYMHRQVANTPHGMECDHINRNTLDDQEHNLRNVTHSQNALNRGPQINNQLREKCISPHSSGYKVRIRRDGKLLFDKWFKDLDEAIAARDAAIKDSHGEFAYRGE